MNPEVGPAHLLVDYAWAVLKANDPSTWDESKYGGMVPIVPLSEEPDLEEFPGPHIVYGYSEDARGDLHVRRRGSISFALYDNNFRRLGRALNILTTALERQDESAADVNRFAQHFGDGHYSGIRLGYISLAFTDGGTPEETEGGRQSGLVSFQYEYYVDYDVITSV